ncbi:hypothetical protein V5799_008683 [Amblyomma americanum]|uniref:Uncharacterized protein n=1 Tax=Amblyomma americanum TaxID=6943 RepID=A0AAQ4FE98_AMBAM
MKTFSYNKSCSLYFCVRGKKISIKILATYVQSMFINSPKARTALEPLHLWPRQKCMLNLPMIMPLITHP